MATLEWPCGKILSHAHASVGMAPNTLHLFEMRSNDRRKSSLRLTSLSR
jgi:hypothetical protein